MAEDLSPFVYWGQNKENIRLLVNIKDVCDPKVELTGDKLLFSSNGLGVNGHNHYKFEVEFYLPVDPENSKYRIMDRGIEFNVRKEGAGQVWPRLMVSQKKPPWLKIDFDHMQFEDESEEEVESNMQMTNQERQMDKLLKELKEEPKLDLPDRLTIYMFLYNLFQFVGYTYVFLAICFRYIRDGEASKAGTYKAVAPQLMMCQIIAVLEVLHPLLGWVRSSPFTALIQVFGRNLVLFGLIAQAPTLQDHPIIWMLFSVWSLVEVIRFPFYILKTVDMEWSFVTYLRYTLWIPLYPIGFMCEGFVIIMSLPVFEESGRWTVILPNKWNMSFHFPTFIKVYMCVFVPGMYILMNHMYELRKKKIGPRQSLKSKLQKKKTR